jgi:major type 1 subunit fimbrin (pilin)
MHNHTGYKPSRRFYKKIAITFAFAAAATMSGIANASDGTIEFEGKILAATCEVEAGMNATKSGKSINVKLPTIGAGSFGDIGSKAGHTNFSIKLKNCEPSANTVQLNFDSYGSNAPPGVELELTGRDGAPVDYNVPTSFPKETLAGDAAEIAYSVSYISTVDHVVAGEIKASIPFTIAYD